MRNHFLDLFIHILCKLPGLDIVAYLNCNGGTIITVIALSVIANSILLINEQSVYGHNIVKLQLSW